MKLDKSATARAQHIFTGLEEKYNKLHDNKYDYSKALYLNSKTKMCIICPDHGEFWQSHNKHYAGQGCPICSGKVRKTTSEFIAAAKKIHGNRYDYSKINYVNQYKNVTIVCPDHGEFQQTPTNHLAGKKCIKCALEERGKNHRLPFEDFLTIANKIHNFKYSYKNYEKASSKLTITCPQHGDFKQEATRHMMGQGCPKCGKYGFQPNKSAVLYYLKINKGTAYKIGITNKSIQDRFLVKELKSIEKLFEIPFEEGRKAYELEQQILKKFTNSQYNGADILSSGNTELFHSDILKGNIFTSEQALKEFLNEN